MGFFLPILAQVLSFFFFFSIALLFVAVLVLLSYKIQTVYSFCPSAVVLKLTGGVGAIWKPKTGQFVLHFPRASLTLHLLSLNNLNFCLFLLIVSSPKIWPSDSLITEQHDILRTDFHISMYLVKGNSLLYRWILHMSQPTTTCTIFFVDFLFYNFTT